MRTRIRCRARMSAWRLPIRCAASPGPPLQQSHRSSRGVEFQRLRPACAVNGSPNPMNHCSPIPANGRTTTILLGSVELTVAAPNGWQHRFTGFRLSLPLHRIERQWRSFTNLPIRSGPMGTFDYPSHDTITSTAWDLNIRAIIPSEPLGKSRPTLPSEFASKTKTDLLETSTIPRKLPANV